MPALAPWPAESVMDAQPALETQESPAYAFLVSYNTDAGTPALAAMLKHGLTVRVAKRPIEVGGKVHPRGTLVITRRNNEAHWNGIETLLNTWTQRPGLDITRLESGMVDGGPDLGAYDVRPLDAPHVSVVMGDEAIMSKKAHGTSATPVQKNLRWNCDFETADRICSARAHERSPTADFNRPHAHERAALPQANRPGGKRVLAAEVEGRCEGLGAVHAQWAKAITCT